MIIELTLRCIVGDVATALTRDQQFSPDPFHFLEQQYLPSELGSPAGCDQPGSTGTNNYYIIIIHGKLEDDFSIKDTASFIMPSGRAGQYLLSFASTKSPTPDPSPEREGSKSKSPLHEICLIKSCTFQS